MRKCWKHLPKNQDQKTVTHYEYTIQYYNERPQAMLKDKKQLKV